MRRPQKLFRPLRDYIASIDAGVSANCSDRPASPGDVRILKTSAVLGGNFQPAECKVVDEVERDRVRTPVLGQTILFCRKNSEEHVGVSALVRSDHPGLFLPDLLWRITPRPEVDAGWLAYVLASTPVRDAIRSRATGTHHSMKNVSRDALLSIEVQDQPEAERHCIAEILSIWDESVGKTERLIASKAVTFDHWSRALLTGRQRLGRNRTNWQSIALTEITRETTARNGARRLDVGAVMGVNKLLGMIPMKDHVRAVDLTRYKIVRPGAFAYNPMRLNIGSLAQNDHGRDVLVSPDYVVFEACPDSLLPAYFDHVRRTTMWSRFVKTAGSGGVRVRIYYDDLADFILELPPLDEQARIIKVLDTGRREIAILERQRDALAKQKRGLMQKLLTGEWTVKVPESQEAAE